MLEDIWVTLSELDNVTFSFKQLDETSVASESHVTWCPPFLPRELHVAQSHPGSPLLPG